MDNQETFSADSPSIVMSSDSPNKNQSFLQNLTLGSVKKARSVIRAAVSPQIDEQGSQVVDMLAKYNLVVKQKKVPKPFKV